MEQQEIDKKITEASKVIFTYCTARTPNQFEAEDLAQDILLEIYKSAPNLRNNKAFYGFMWSVAGNVYKAWCKNRHKKIECELTDQVPDIAGSYEELSDDLFILRRELTLLLQKYRRAAILYYIDNYSCLEIARILSISESMVKYLLFKARQILKEGFFMERSYGEQSYNPKELSLFFWGNGANPYYHLCDSKISQNILFACYNDKLTADQISLAIGVALPYMEDQLKELCEYGLLKKDGNRYDTNIVIFTKDFMAEVEQKTTASRDRIADILMQTVKEKEKEIRDLRFIGADMNCNSFSWQMVCILLYQAIVLKLQSQLDIVYPVDQFGISCFVWGVERLQNNPGGSPFDFGISTAFNEFGDSIEFMDFPINGEMVHPYMCRDAANVFLDIARGNSSNFSVNDKSRAADMIKMGYVRMEKEHFLVNAPVFTQGQFDSLVKMLENPTDMIVSEAKKIMSSVANILKNHIPVHLKKQAKDMAYLRLFEDAISAPVQHLFEQKFLIPYHGEGMLPTTYVVLK